MQCKKARTFYMLMVQYDVVDEEGPPTATVMNTPVLRNPPGVHPMSPMVTADMEASVYVNKEDAETARVGWSARFPDAVYSVMEVTPR